jgi:hypothetical protein
MTDHGEGSADRGAVAAGEEAPPGAGPGFYRTLVRNTAAGMLTIDAEGVVLFANPAVADVLGHDPGSLEGEPLLDIVPDALADRHETGFERYLRTDERRVDWDGLELTARHAEGHEVPVRLRLREHVHEGERLFTGTLERRSAEGRERERTLVELVERSPDVLWLYRGAFEELLYMNSSYEAAWGQPIERVERDPAAFLEAIHPEDRDEATAAMYRLLDGEPIDIEVRVNPRADYGRWAWIQAEPILQDGEIARIVGVTRDVTDRKDRERTIENWSTAVSASIDGIAVLDHDETHRYVNRAHAEMYGYDDPEALVGEGWQVCYGDEETERFERVVLPALEAVGEWRGEAVGRRADGSTFPQEVSLSRTSDGRIVCVVRDITERRERERTLARQRNSLERVQQVTRSLRPLNRGLARASTVEEIRQLVADQLAASDAYAFAWYGEYDRTHERVIPTAFAGVDEGFVDELDAHATGDGSMGELAGTAVVERDVRAARHLLTDTQSAAWRESALERGHQAAAAVPVVFGDTVYGVVGVYTSRPDAFDEYERGLLRELGERVGHAINAAENKRLLHTDTVVELEFRVEDPALPLVTATAALDCRLTLASFVPTGDGTAVAYQTVEGAAPAAVAGRLRGSDRLDEVRVVSGDGTAGTLELRVRDSPLTCIVEQGATIRSLVVEEGVATLTVEAAPGTDSYALLATLEADYPETTLLAKRTVDRSVGASTGTREAIAEALTDRQWEALRLAHQGGFFASPRHSSGEELADALGIASPTFYQHVRRGTDRLLTALDERDLLS